MASSTPSNPYRKGATLTALFDKLPTGAAAEECFAAKRWITDRGEVDTATVGGVLNRPTGQVAAGPVRGTTSRTLVEIVHSVTSKPMKTGAGDMVGKQLDYDDPIAA